MKHFRHRWFALLLSLLLLSSQQAAFAHLLTHVQGGQDKVARIQNLEGAIDGAAETCTSCIAFAGVGGSAPPVAVTSSIDVVVGDSYLLPLVVAVASRPATRHRARAPPTFL